MTTQISASNEFRRAQIVRETSETRIKIDLDLNGSGKCDVRTGIGFFDHMLNQLGHHALIDLTVKADGDLSIDCHHTVEDTGLALGEAFSKALGDRKGINRMADATVPMDESLVQTCVDFSGRPYCVFKSNWRGEEVGNMPVSLIEHFWASFAITAGCNIHIRVLDGSDNHHMAEAVFKSAARAIQSAIRIDPQRAGSIPSTKGMIQTRNDPV